MNECTSTSTILWKRTLFTFFFHSFFFLLSKPLISKQGNASSHKGAAQVQERCHLLNSHGSESINVTFFSPVSQPFHLRFCIDKLEWAEPTASRNTSNKNRKSLLPKRQRYSAQLVSFELEGNSVVCMGFPVLIIQRHNFYNTRLKVFLDFYLRLNSGEWVGHLLIVPLGVFNLFHWFAQRSDLIIENLQPSNEFCTFNFVNLV